MALAAGGVVGPYVVLVPLDAGWGNPDWTANDPDFESLHELARFGEILARMRAE